MNQNQGTDLIMDELSNAIDYLQRAVQFVKEIEEDSWSIKWATIALHGAIYGFGVVAVCGVLAKTDDYNVVNIHRKGKRHLKSFDEIVKLWKNTYNNSCHGRLDHQISVPEITSEQESAIDWLKTYVRNPVEHFIPCTYIMGTQRVPEKLNCCFEVIELFALNSFPGSYKLSSNQISEIENLIAEGKKELSMKNKCSSNTI